MSKESLEVLARLSDTKIEVRDFVDRWLLLTYDIPHTDEGDKARRGFLMQAHAIGATRHTDSVYLMPWTPAAEVLALQLARVGDVIVWTSSTTDTNQAKEITKNYDASLRPLLDEVAERMDRIAEHLAKNRNKRAESMRIKTEQMLGSLEQAIQRRGSAELYVLWQILNRRFWTL